MDRYIDQIKHKYNKQIPHVYDNSNDLIKDGFICEKMIGLDSVYRHDKRDQIALLENDRVYAVLTNKHIINK